MNRLQVIGGILQAKEAGIEPKETSMEPTVGIVESKWTVDTNTTRLHKGEQAMRCDSVEITISLCSW